MILGCEDTGLVYVEHLEFAQRSSIHLKRKHLHRNTIAFSHLHWPSPPPNMLASTVRSDSPGEARCEEGHRENTAGEYHRLSRSLPSTERRCSRAVRRFARDEDGDVVCR